MFLSREFSQQACKCQGQKGQDDYGTHCSWGSQPAALWRTHCGRLTSVAKKMSLGIMSHLHIRKHVLVMSSAFWQSLSLWENVNGNEKQQTTASLTDEYLEGCKWIKEILTEFWQITESKVIIITSAFTTFVQENYWAISQPLCSRRKLAAFLINWYKFPLKAFIYNLAARGSLCNGECGPRSEKGWKPLHYKYIHTTNIRHDLNNLPYELRCVRFVHFVHVTQKNTMYWGGGGIQERLTSLVHATHAGIIFRLNKI
jgi:hypothetical protein